jgi:hypothetical protein
MDTDGPGVVQPVVEAYDVHDPSLTEAIQQARALGCDLAQSTLDHWKTVLGSDFGPARSPLGTEYLLDLRPFSNRDPSRTIILIRFEIPNEDLRDLPRPERVRGYLERLGLNPKSVSFSPEAERE